jgi:hypothetical protein
VRQAAYAVSMVALVATVAPAFAFYGGGITLDQLKLAMTIATFAWFVATPIWMGRAPRTTAEAVITTGAADRSL